MSLEIGQKIQEDKYSIVRLLGEGGMGAVYEGLNNKIQRKVAIKVLHASVSENSDAVARFEREATAAGRIGSDHITEVLDMGELPGGARYMVMEYMDGVSLSKRIEDRGRLNAQEAAQIVVQVLDGLIAAHEAGIIHRDLKPDNVFLLKSKAGRKDYVKILDFGISKFNAMSGDNLSMTKTNAVLGTPYYMSPEQAKGSKAVDQRCDVYSVGVILYESVTGQVPFDADTFNELIFKIVLEAPPPPEQFVPDLDPNISAIIRRAMARDATQRFQSAAEFRDALVTWMESGHVPMFQESATNVARNAMQSVPSDMSQYRGTHSAGTPATPAPWTGDASGAEPAPQPPKSNGAIIGVAVLGALALVAAIGIFVVKPALSKDSGAEAAATQAPSASSAPTTPASATSATTPAATSAPVASATPPEVATAEATAAKPATPAGGSKGNTPSAGAGAAAKPTATAGKPGGRGVRTTLDLSARVRHELLVKIAAVQMNSHDDVAKNLATVRARVAEAARAGAKVVLLPENFAFMGGTDEQRREVMESLDGGGPIMSTLFALASEHAITLIGGGLPEKSAVEGRVHNTLVVISPDAKIQASYRKIHLFDVDAGDGQKYRESDAVVPGDRAVVTTIGDFKVGLSICYDLRFPELYRKLVDEGAEVLVVPAAFTLMTGKDHWHALLRARAIENQCFVVAAAQWGSHPKGRLTYGKSLVIDPWGDVIAQASDGEGLVISELDRSRLVRLRSSFPALSHRRV